MSQSLAGGPAFAFLFGCWTLTVLIFWIIGQSIASRAGRPNDGCLFAGLNAILALIGGTAAFALTSNLYPYSIIASVVGCFTLPAINTVIQSNRYGRTR